MKARILVIDDEPLLRQSLVFVLKRAQYSAISARNGEEGLFYIYSEPFDLILLDSRMPDMDSFSILHRLSGINPQTKVIMFTTDSRQETVQRAFHEGAFAYLIKPIDPDILMKVISDLLYGKPLLERTGVLLNPSINSLD
jgi:DNA-binding NtrC family response regulator